MMDVHSQLLILGVLPKHSFGIMVAERKKVNRLALSTQHARGVLLSFRHNREVSTNRFQIMAVERKEVDRLPQGFSTH